MLMPRITNDSSKPALYAIVRLYVDARLKIEPRKWTLQPETTLMWMGKPTPFSVLRYSWSIPVHHSLLEGEEYTIPEMIVSAGENHPTSAVIGLYRLGWDVRTPRALPKRQRHRYACRPKRPTYRY